MKILFVLALAVVQGLALPKIVGESTRPINIEVDGDVEISNLPSGQDQVEISNLPSDIASEVEISNLPADIASESGGIQNPSILPTEIESEGIQDPSNLPAEIESGDVQDPNILPTEIESEGIQDPSNLPAQIESGDTQKPSNLPAEIESENIQDPSKLPIEIESGNVQDPAQLPAAVESSPVPACVQYVRTLLEEVLRNLPESESIDPVDRPVVVVDVVDPVIDESNACELCFQKIQLLIEKSNSLQSVAITF